jgi:threonine dehydrogenase-like Zn-dependent dehydrogenase
LPFHGEGLFKASMSEPMSCILGAFNSHYHFKTGEHVHTMGIVEKGAMAILAGAGPMGLGAIDYTLRGPRQPRLLAVTDIDQARLDRAAEIFPIDEAWRCDVDLRYVNTSNGDAVGELRAINGGGGYDDVFVFAPVEALVTQASSLLCVNGCLNFFAGPTTSDFWASMNFYDIHYSGHHVVGSSGGNAADMREGLDLMAKDVINPAVLITHVGGLDSAAETILNLPSIHGGKKLIYTQKSMPLVAIDEFAERGRADPFYSDLAAIAAEHNGLWSLEAEQYVLENARDIVP